MCWIVAKKRHNFFCSQNALVKEKRCRNGVVRLILHLIIANSKKLCFPCFQLRALCCFFFVLEKEEYILPPVVMEMPLCLLIYQKWFIFIWSLKQFKLHSFAGLKNCGKSWLNGSWAFGLLLCQFSFYFCFHPPLPPPLPSLFRGIGKEPWQIIWVFLKILS